MKTTRLLLFNGFRFKEIEVRESLDDYYENLECSTFDITHGEINGKVYDIFCDDEGLFKEDPETTAVFVNKKGVPNGVLVGNLIFANHDSAGNTTSLSDEDIESIKRSVSLLLDGEDKMSAVVVLKR